MEDKEKTIEEMIKEVMKYSVKDAMGMMPKLLELEAIQNWFDTMYGLDIIVRIKPIKRTATRNLGAGIIEELFPPKS